MSYESPIEIVKTMHDRCQYEKGYTEGYNQGIKDAVSKLKEYAAEEHFMRTEYIIDEDTINKLIEEYSK